MKRCLRFISLFLLLAANPATAGDTEDLTALLQDFLANADAKAAHERFWDDALVYTSSRGARTDKASILASFEEATEEAEDGPVYSAEEVQVQLHGDTAVVAFKLVATPSGDGAVLHYLNTGTFVRRENGWRVVAWQATAIPAAE